MSEPPLLTRVAAGESSAMEQCVAQFGPLIWSAAQRYLGASHEAEDAVQEIFIQLWQHAERYDATLGSETTFVMVLARRRLMDWRRRVSRRPEWQPLDEAHELSLPNVPELGPDDEANRALKALAGLPSGQRQVIELSLCDGNTHQEISSRLALPLGTVKTLLRRGLLRLRQALRSGTEENLP